MIKGKRQVTSDKKPSGYWTKEKCQEEDENIDDKQKADLPAWQTSQQVLDPNGAVYALKH